MGLAKYMMAPVTSVALASGASGAFAQDSDWERSATIYLFTAETKTGIGTPALSLESTLSFEDALENLDFAFMGAFEAHNGRWGVLADLLYLDLSFSNPTPGPAFSGIRSNLQSTVAQVSGLYRAYDQSNLRLDLMAGVRWFNVDTTIALLPGAAPGAVNASSRDWFDPVVGIRAGLDFSEKWSSTVLLDYGGFSSDSESYQALVSVNYEVYDSWVLRGGYRFLSYENTDNLVKIDIEQSGPIFGATYNF